MTTFTPLQSALGGAMIGLAAVWLMGSLGRIMGMTGIFSGALFQLDIAGDWDPSLIFVMGGAFAVTFLGYRLALRRPRPLFQASFRLPERRDLDPALVGGSVLFGVGWGIAGFCPGGAIPALGLGQPDAAIFVGAMLGGIALARRLRVRGQTQKLS